MNHISIVQGDITLSGADVIVNAANPQMLGGGGVDGAIHKAAGTRLLEECRKIKPVRGIRCPFGYARITPAGNLNSKYVIHAVGPIYANEKNPESILERTYINVLDLVVKHGCTSVAFPAISCGAYGFPVESAAKISVGACMKYLTVDIRFHLIDETTVKYWRMEIAKTCS